MKNSFTVKMTILLYLSLASSLIAQEQSTVAQFSRQLNQEYDKLNVVYDSIENKYEILANYALKTDDLMLIYFFGLMAQIRSQFQNTRIFCSAIELLNEEGCLPDKTLRLLYVQFEDGNKGLTEYLKGYPIIRQRISSRSFENGRISGKLQSDIEEFLNMSKNWLSYYALMFTKKDE